MNILPLAKREMNLLKWVMLSVLIIIFGNLALFDSVMDSRVNGLYVVGPNYSYSSVNPFFGSLPSTQFLYILIIVLATVQFYGLSSTFLFSLPIQKDRVIGMKMITGIGLYSVGVMIYGFGLVHIFLKNRGWLERVYAYVPAELYGVAAKHNSVSYILQYLLLLWLALTAAYSLAVFLQIILRNKIFAAIVAFVVLWFPSFFYSYMSSGVSRYVDKTASTEFNTEKYNELMKILDRVKIFSLPEFQTFEGSERKESFVSYVDGIVEMVYDPSISMIISYTPKILMAVSLIMLFIHLIFRCYQSSYIGEEKDMVVFPYMRNLLLGFGSSAGGLVVACFFLIQFKSFLVFWAIIPVAGVAIFLVWKVCLNRWNAVRRVKR